MTKISDYSDVIVPDKFWAQVDVRGDDECWEWTRSSNKSGYGIYHCRSPKWLYEKNGRTMAQLSAHRVSWFLKKGDVGSEHVTHTCGNKKCCNPAHMYSGNFYDNMVQSWQHGKK